VAIRVGALEGMVSPAGIWSGRRVLVTGHTGFKGGWLALWLHALGAKVTGYSLPPPTDPSLYDCIGLARLVEHVIADVRDLPAFERCIRHAQPEVVFHLAAQALVRRSYEDPVETYGTNVLGTAVVLDAVRRAGGVRAVVVVTSDKCYENREWEWGYRENDALGGHDPYSNSKGCAEMVAASFRSSFFGASSFASHGVALGTARAGNVIGGGDWAEDRLVPDIVRAVGRGEAVAIRNPAATRPWQHVLEPVGAYLLLAEKLLAGGPQFAESWNFGPDADDCATVQGVLERIAGSWDAVRWSTDPGQHPHEARALSLDCSKAAHRLGWRPRLKLDAGIDWTVQWYRAWLEKQDLQRLCLEQIERFTRLGAAT
jgi:CDP-glucose 4,6-dehydratase